MTSKYSKPLESMEDAAFAKSYLIKKCRSDSEFLEVGTMTDAVFAERLEENELSDEIDLRHFNVLCGQNLTKIQWSKLRVAIRQRRKNAGSEKYKIEVTKPTKKRFLEYLKDYGYESQDEACRALLKESGYPVADEE